MIGEQLTLRSANREDKVCLDIEGKNLEKPAFDERFQEMEHGLFSPLVFSTAGGMGSTANVVYKQLASMIADKHKKGYSKTINWLRCKLSFSVLRSAIMCLRGSRSSLHNPICSAAGDIGMSIVEGQGSL